MSYPYTNQELYDMFRDSKEANFVRFLEKLEKKLEKESEETCGFCDEPCGNDWCVTKRREVK